MDNYSSTSKIGNCQWWALKKNIIPSNPENKNTEKIKIQMVRPAQYIKVNVKIDPKIKVNIAEKIVRGKTFFKL